MARKRLTERFPFLLPLRRWQRKRCFYLKMYFDGCRYAAVRTKTPLEYTLFRANVAMRNERSGFPMEYQQNKVHNLRLAAEAMNGVVLHPSETFSFWRLARRADRHTPYKDGLVLVNGSVRPAYGGGLCMLSDLLYWCFLHTPLTVTERHGHAVEQPPQNQRAAAQYDDAYGQAVLFAFLLHNGILHGCKHPAMGAARRPGTFFIIIPVYSPNFQPFVKKLFV